MWFIFTLVTLFAWGSADLFYKEGAELHDKYSHLKTTMAVGFVMGISALLLLIKNDFNYDLRNLYIYLPVSAMYILSMVIGYLGLRYLELSISSPIQNSSGAVCALLCVIFLKDRIEGLALLGVCLISLGLILLGILERIDAKKLMLNNEKKYKIGFVAIIFPFLYCIIDSLGTFFDAYYLDDHLTSPLKGVNENNLEDVANISYEFTFFIISLLIFIFLYLVKKEKRNVKMTEKRIFAAVFETLGQATYVYAMSSKAQIAAPVISAYSIVSLVLSRIFLKEKLSLKHYLVIGLVILGIAILGFTQG